MEVLPGFSHFDPVADIKCLFISPVDHSRQYLCLETMQSSEDGFNFVHLRELMEHEWDSPELVQASKTDCVQLIICDSLIKASQNFKLSVGGYFHNIFLQDKEKSILSLFRNENVGVIAIGHFVKNASPKFFSALSFEPVDLVGKVVCRNIL